MTVNAIGFYAVAALLVLAAAATVGLTSLRQSGIAALATAVLLAALLAVSGAIAVAVVQLVVVGVTAAVSLRVLRGDAQQGLVESAPETPAPRAWLGATIALAVALLLGVTFSTESSSWFSGASGVTHLITLLHYRTPYALVIAAVLAAVSAGAAVLIGRRSADEQALDRHLQARRLREERSRRRREDREQARRRPGSAPREGDA